MFCRHKSTNRCVVLQRGYVKASSANEFALGHGWKITVLTWRAHAQHHQMGLVKHLAKREQAGPVQGPCRAQIHSLYPLGGVDVEHANLVLREMEQKWAPEGEFAGRAQPAREHHFVGTRATA